MFSHGALQLYTQLLSCIMGSEIVYWIPESRLLNTLLPENLAPAETYLNTGGDHWSWQPS